MFLTADAPWLLTAARVLCVAAAALASNDARAADVQHLYDGRSLDEWRQEIQRIDFRSPDRGTAVPGLREIVLDRKAPWFTRRQAALTLGRIGEPAQVAVSDLVALLDAPVDPVETSPPLWAMKSLALFGPLAVEAAPKAVGILQNERLPILLRLTSTETLGRIGVGSAEGVRALIDGGRASPDDSADALELRIACIEALQLPRPSEAVPTLTTACEDGSERVRLAAAATLGSLGSHAEPAAEVLAALVIHDEAPVVREAAARALAQVGPRGAEILVRLFSSSDEQTVLLAIDGASRATLNRPALAAGLAGLFNHHSQLIAARAMNASWRLTRKAGPILMPLVGLVASDDRSARKSASDTLIEMGSAAISAKAELESLVGNGTAATRTAARRVLQRMTGNEEPR